MILAEGPVEVDVFEDRHHFNAHSPESGYAKVITAQRRHKDGVTLMRGCVLTRIGQDGVTKHTCESLPEWLEVLEKEFDLSLDARCRRAGVPVTRFMQLVRPAPPCWSPWMSTLGWRCRSCATARLR